ncbi:MAG: hypothetical protein CL676_10630 [Bdellovibrionaceae bacterium]|nr:hypothetical protein [Pseudobdellovibrionaceae bacterium]
MKIPFTFAAFISLLNFSPGALGQTVVSLFPEEGQVAGVTIPFEVQGEDGLSVEAITLDQNSAGCVAALDKFRKSIFHVRCAHVGQFSGTLIVVQNGNALSRSFPTVEIGEGGGIEPIGGPTPGGVNDIQEGSQYFASYCIRCHSNPASKKGKSAAQLNSALSSNGTMASDSGLQSLRNDLSAAELDSVLQKISKYLGSL